MIILRILAFPFALLYHFLTAIRNRLYDQGIRPSLRFDLPVIGVGNLTVGGTGKTPLTEYLIRLLTKNNTIATLSRGYGRKTKGFFIAKPSDTADSLGDEPFQLYQKFKDKVIVSVGEDRAFAIPNILQEHPETTVVLLDDAYQHRTVSPSLNILLSDYHRPFYHDFILPAGRLRESRTGAKRADVILVTKCPPALSETEKQQIKASIEKYSTKPVFFTHIRYSDPVAFGGHAGAFISRIVLLTGIADSKPLLNYAKQHFTVLKHFDLRDHHAYSHADVLKLKEALQEFPEACILTTEKDKVKLASFRFSSQVVGLPLFYLPIEVVFNENGQDFDSMVLNSLQRAG